METQGLCGLPPDELAALLSPLPRFRAAQIFRWMSKGVLSFEKMRNLPRSLREDLGRRFSPGFSRIESRRDGKDGTVKIVVGLGDGAKIEAVLLGDSRTRHTACLSTQAGCQAGCVFCKTGSLGFMRNLCSAEMVEQLLFLRSLADIGNIVIMGMGEPLFNLGELRRALAVIGSAEGLGFSPRRITLSTCGVSEGILDLAEKGPPVRLALSLTTADERLREKLMPITRRYPLGELKKAIVRFQQNGGGRVTLEAVLLGGVNTRVEDAEALAEFERGLDAVVNLIPWNPAGALSFEGLPLRSPSPGETGAFAACLEARGLKVTRRFRRGRDVMGACGQLGVVPAI
jgi:23S rRNA (adenine2503-C2)-methyltransferase